MQKTNYHSIFKNIYYHLYSNSNSSRAESLLSDITKLLLYSYVSARGKGGGVSFSADEILNSLENEYRNTSLSLSPFSLDEGCISAILPSLLLLDFENAPANIVGEAVQAIIGPRIRGDKGQFFTPESLVRCITDIVDISDNDLVVDPACGTGGFLSAAHNKAEKRAVKIKLVGADKDVDMANLAFAVMQIEADNYSEVECCNSLEAFNPENPLNKYLGKANKVLTNPPFGSKIGITDQNILQNYQFGHVWTYSKRSNKWERTDRTARKQDPQILFLELCVNLLRDGGTLGIVLPEGIFYSKNLGYLWQYLSDMGSIVALLDVPRNAFQPSTDTKTNVLIFRKGAHRTSFEGTWFAQANSCGHDRRGRTTSADGNPIPDDFPYIGESWKDRELSTSCWVKDHPENDLYIPRYYVNRSSLSSKDERRRVSLGELIDSGDIVIRSGHEVGSDAYGTGNIPYVRTSDINNFEIAADPTNSVSEDVYLKYSSQENLKPNDILFIADGRYRIGKTAIVSEYNSRCVIQSHIDIITVQKTAPFSPYELLYLINSKDVQRQIKNLVFVSSTLGTIGSRIRELSIPIPKRDSAWNQTIERFESTLKKRASLLSVLNEYESKDSD